MAFSAREEQNYNVESDFLLSNVPKRFLSLRPGLRQESLWGGHPALVQGHPRTGQEPPPHEPCREKSLPASNLNTYFLL